MMQHECGAFFWRSSLVVLLCVFVVGIAGCVPQHEKLLPPRAVQGELDLSGWDFQRDGPAALSGEWAFSWQDAGNPSGLANPTTSDFLQVPGLWHGQTVHGKTFSATGYGTYRLRVVLPENLSAPMSLFVAGIVSVCDVWTNQNGHASSGVLGKDKASEQPSRHFVVADFYPSGNILEISLRVSNFHNVQGGITGIVRLGTARQIDRMLSLRWITGAFMGGALLCMSLFYLVLFFARRRARENIYFGLFCLFWGVSIFFSPSCGFLGSELWPSLPWTWYVTISLLPMGLTVPLVLMFYHSLFPKKYGNVVQMGFLALGLLFIGYLLLTPANGYDPVVFGYFVITRTAFIYLLLCVGRDIYTREKGIFMLLPGYLALAYAELDDILFDLNIFQSADFGPYGVFIFVLSYSLFLSVRFSQSFVRAERLSERLVQLDKLKDEFLANTTHELKTPLTGMVGIAENLLAGGKLADATRESLEVVVHSGRRLSRLINDVLVFSRLRHQDITLRKEAVSLHVVVQQVFSVLRGLDEENRVELRNHVSPEFPLVLADQDRLEQILVNLLGNSLKFAQQGEIIVSAALKHGMAEVSVTDLGPGIPVEDQERIFNAYEQSAAPGTFATGGTGGAGLGLYIARRLVELHGGSIHVASGSEQGSTFTFTLPLCKGSAAGKAALAKDVPLVGRGAKLAPIPTVPPVVEDADSGGKYQVLVVDDEPVNRHVVGSCLRLAGITFRTAPDGTSALRLLENGDQPDMILPDMILLDVMMPAPDGYAVCRELRKNHSASALPVILLTVRSSVEDIVAGFAAGANDYLTKPFSRDELIARVNTQLKLHEAYGILQENLNLKKELDLRRQTEQGLRQRQLRLARILDSLDDALLAVNLSREVGFCNRAFEELTGYRAGDLLGRPAPSLFFAPHNADVQELLGLPGSNPQSSGRPRVFEDVQLRAKDGKGIGVTIFATDVEVEEEPLALLVVRPLNTADSRQDMMVSAAMLEQLNANRQRILNLEEAMLAVESGDEARQLGMVEDLKTLDGLLERMGNRLSARMQAPGRRQLAVEVMMLCVTCWEGCTGTSKADLAEQSGLWNVYMEKDGYFRTQTLDKYLSQDTLPQKPRWQKIHATADFVLMNCSAELPVCRKLQDAFSRLKSLS
ncbi:MAG: ATP-binding protein [Desulfovibrio sp.]|uniref:ATP-binding protein n=1 Tax=Desulfovibrio sp. 7SRBS1 TaxID=3378064 RepID=UPI003B401A1C